MKKYMALSLSAILSVSLLSACGTNDEQAADNLNNYANRNAERLSFEPGGNNYENVQNGDGKYMNRFDVQGKVRKYTIPGGDVQEYNVNPEEFGINPKQFENGQQAPGTRNGNNGQQQQQQQGGNEQQQPQAERGEAPSSDGKAPEETSENKNFKQQVVDLTNKEREKKGLPKVKAFDELTNVAQKKSEDMVNNGYFSHNSPTYGSPFEMMDNFGIEYKTAAENIAAGQKTPEKVVKGWMNSAGHRKNILNNKVTHIGIGVERGGDMGIYWTQMFIQK
ncbi:CAP domain-containing protein [Pontibacillus salicampi]|uniref:CAP domain-containing protein n=1 Tax=Pontibacillus salicampi TaxID=1449801 RepID=A0ABV6LPV1_9BACI